jgi:hypothetical protein
MKLRLRRPRDLALALRELARRRPRQAVDYLDAHEEEWSSLAESDPHDAADILEAIAGEDAAELISDLDPGDAADVLEEMHDEAAATSCGTSPLTPPPPSRNSPPRRPPTSSDTSSTTPVKPSSAP